MINRSPSVPLHPLHERLENLERLKMSNSQLESRGANLRKALIGEYGSLMHSGRLSPQIGGTDITNIVTQYLPGDTTFDDAESILRSAGFAIRARPTELEQRNPNRARDWDAVLAAMDIPDHRPMTRSVVYVVLHPHSPLDYRRIAAATAAIRTSHP